MALVGETYNDVRDVMIEGHSGLLSVHRNNEMPDWHSTQRKLVWPNGVIGQDGFRIRIWKEQTGDNDFVLYDNGLGVDETSGNGGTTALGGGSIIIHSSKKK